MFKHKLLSQALKGGALAGAIGLASKFGLIGDVLAFSATVSTAATLRAQGRDAEANELWMRYIFETGGGGVGTILGIAVTATALKGVGGPIPVIIGALLGGVGGSLAGAPLGSALYQTKPELFDPYFEDIYGKVDTAVAGGGEGSDFLFNTSYKGQLWGDGFGGRPIDNPETPEDESLGDSDVFWFWPNTFIMDAQQNDILQMFGWPLTGGTNAPGGFAINSGALAVDWLNWTTYYQFSTSGQLIIKNLLAELAGFGGPMVVENYTFGGFKDAEWGRLAAGDLGMTFRIAVPEGEGVEISVWNSVWGHLFTYLDVIGRFAKLLSWQPADDPLVLDLDGDGIETVSVDQSGVHFDLDGDYFAEKTGWIGADDGFLVRDLNGNGLIDDITEMFGAPGVSAFAELAELDKVENGGNADGFITLDDAAFSELQVWRDLDQDGATDAGELFTLDDLDIVSISVAGDGVESPTGTTLREGASFTFGDGSTGNAYEAIFETDATDTIFRGERGVAEWQRLDDPSISNIPDAKGLGSMADLTVQAASDFALADTILAATSAMGLDANGLPSLKQLRADAAPVYGEWSQSMELTRELVPVLLNKAANNNELQNRRAA